ncbi:ComEC/Rec2 family competence protein [Microbacterium sp. 1.5R]|uniref:ComEC/Rec2 family competence protein n=1 Tax=Microbacterium sp. 1.5R TaxID=1916917 RepID=UPI0011A56E8F|nr:ComEC/Rec2 family competence protein [Microbacterium sp. 1.5R]
MAVRTEVVRAHPGSVRGAARDVRLLPVACGAWAVALVCVFVPSASGWVAGGCVLGAVVVAGVVARCRLRVATVGGLVVVVLAVGAAVAFTVLSESVHRDAAREWDGRVVEAVGEVSSSASVGRDGRLWMDVQLRGIGPPGAVRAASAPMRVGVDPAEGFDLGAVVRVTGEAAATEAGERAALVLFASTASVEQESSGVFAVAAGLRHQFIERSTRLPEPGAGLLPGLAVGDTRAVDTELNDAMRISGLSHLTAVSGANCAIVVGAVFWLAALCGAGRGTRILLAAVALAGFVILVTPEPSVIRAAVMAGVAMLAILTGRPSAGAGMLALSAAGILVVDPWLASTPGFALSVVASGALILLAPVLSRGLERWMPRPLALSIAVPLAAQLACGPIIALFAEQQSLVGLAANLLAAPAAPVATVIGLLACLSAPLPMLADLLAASAWLPASWIAATADVTSRMPFAEVAVPPGILSAAVVAGVSGCIAIVLAGERVRIPGVRATASILLAGGVAVAGAQVLLTGPIAHMTTPAGWSVAACDVGQGDALLVRSEQQVALIDTGPEPASLAACLRSLGVARTDLLVLTHFDLDHVGGVDAVQGRVGAVLHGPVAEPADLRTLDRLRGGGATMTQASAGMRGDLGAAAWKVLWPERESRAFPTGNDASVVIEIGGAGVPRSLFLGDLSAEPQGMLRRSGRVRGPYEIVKVAHHGSADQDPSLYEQIDAAVMVFSVGLDNDYGHPRTEALGLAGVNGARALRTDFEGRLLLGTHEGVLEVWTERRPP